MSKFRNPNQSLRTRRALTLVESVVAMAIVGVMLVAALNTVGASQVAQKKLGDRARATLLAQDLMSEILQQAYEDPDGAAGSFGLGSDEVGAGNRALWEDVDDYNGWSAAPPQCKDGTVIPGFDGWRRIVEVKWVRTADHTIVDNTDTGVKRITVTVLYQDAPLAKLVALRTNALQYEPGD